MFGLPRFCDLAPGWGKVRLTQLGLRAFVFAPRDFFRLLKIVKKNYRKIVFLFKSGILFRLRRNRTDLRESSAIFGACKSTFRILKTRLREKLSSGLRVWAPAFQAFGLGFDI